MKYIVKLVKQILRVKNLTKKKTLEYYTPAYTIDNAVIITMAYPNELVRTTRAFYSRLLPFFGFGRPGFIRAGHACMVLARKDSEEFEYFDFGRYITPIGMARARGLNHDPDVKIEVKAKWSNGRLVNVNELLNYLYMHPEKTRGEGDLYASISENANYQRVKDYVSFIQSHGMLPYGPFISNGTNCARFVTDAIINGTLDKAVLKRMNKIYRITPSVLDGVDAANTLPEYYLASHNGVRTSSENLQDVQRMFLHDKGRGYENLVDTQRGKLEEPEQPAPVDGLKWLGGVGYGVWYGINQTENDGIFQVSQYSATGKHNFTAHYQSNEQVDLNKDFSYGYPSHYEQIILNFDGREVKLLRQNVAEKAPSSN